MSLVPIIYTSLVLVVGLLLIFVVISYLIYKVKATTNPVIQEELQRSQVNVVRKKALSNHSINYPLVQPIQYHNHNVIERDNPQILPADYFQQTPTGKTSKVENFSDRNKDHFRNETQHTSVRNNMRENKTRFEIMNDSSFFRNNNDEKIPESLNKRIISPSFDKTEYNLLSFYSDYIESKPKKVSYYQSSAI